LQKKDLKMREAKLVDKQACGLDFFDRRDLPAELEELRTRVAGVEEERAVKVGKLAALVVEASNTLVDLGMLPIWEVP
jgi:hypothetical protein